MELGTRRFGDALVLSAEGRIDHATAEAFRVSLFSHLDTCTAGRDRVVLDMSAVEYVASVGLRALMLAHRRVKAEGGVLVVAALQPVVFEIFEISRFSMILRVFPTVREAIAAVAPSSLAAYDAA
jgi:anti-anti-sigma factor